MLGVIIAPSCLMSSQLHNEWKIHILKGIYSQALEVIEEVDSSLVTVPQKNSLLAVQNDASHLLRVFPDTSPASKAATFASQDTFRQPKGPLIHEPIPGSSRIPDPFTGSSGKKKKKVFICEICVVEKSKQQDLVDHKRNIHGEGKEDTPHCDICNKDFGTKSSLKLHTKSKHEEKYIHNCELWDYQTNSKQQFSSHVKGHGSKEQQKLDKMHKCPNCSKGFFTNVLLKKRLNADTCQISEKKL